MAKPPPVPTEPAARLAEAERELAEALVAGVNTAPLRQRISTIRDEIAAQAEVAAAERTMVEQAEQQAIAERAHEVASAAVSRLARTLDGLTPPPAPWSLPTGDRLVLH